MEIPVIVEVQVNVAWRALREGKCWTLNPEWYGL
jgi:hypothetical protein